MNLANVAAAHIAYWLFGAIWPLADIKSFERVTGHKREDWLVRTVALLMLSVVASLAMMSRTRRDDEAMRVLGATSAGALGSVAIIGSVVRRISPLYIIDGIVDLSLVAAWLSAED